MKKIFLFFVLLIPFIEKVSAQTPSFYLDEIIQQSDLGITPVGAYTYTFDPDGFLENYSSVSTTEYSFLWSFGDGSYSTEHYPEYTYADVADLTEYQVVLYATPIYTPIGPPPAALLVSDFISIGSGSSVSPRPYMEDVNLQLSYNRAPRGSYESTFILTYRNIAPTAQTFDVHFDFNDAHLEYLDIIAPGGEILDQQTTLNSTNYNQRLIFNNGVALKPQEERTIFIQMKATDAVMGEIEEGPNGELIITNSPDIYANAESSLGETGVLYNDEEVMQAVGSWDPNNKIASVQFINRDENPIPDEITYRINCENIGTGSTSTVTITDNVSSLLDFNSFTFVGDKNGFVSNVTAYPNTTITPYQGLTITLNSVNNEIEFDYSALQLKGTNSPNEVNIEECRHWIDIKFDIDPVEFENQFGSSVSCGYTSLIGSFGRDAEIVFDEHTPIITNVASTEVFCEVIQPPIDIVNVAPNPARNLTTISYDINSINVSQSNVKTFLLNVNTGTMQLLTYSSLDLSVGTHNLQLDLSNENHGSYKFIMQSNGVNFESSTIIKI